MFKCVYVCAHITFFQPHITKNICGGYIDTERAVIWPALSKMPNRKQANIIIIGTVMHLFWATYTEGIVHLWLIFLKFLPFYTIWINMDWVFWYCNEFFLLITMTLYSLIYGFFNMFWKPLCLYSFFMSSRRTYLSLFWESCNIDLNSISTLAKFICQNSK